MAKLFNNAGDKPILPSILKPPIAMTKPANPGRPQRANLAFRATSSAAYTPTRRTRHHHGAVDSDVQTSPRRLGEVRPSILLKGTQEGLNSEHQPILAIPKNSPSHHLPHQEDAQGAPRSPQSRQCSDELGPCLV